VLDESGRRVRNVNFVDGGAGGCESGERRVRDNDGRGGRGGGWGGSRSGGGKTNPRLVNASITSAVCPQGILAVVRDNLLVLDHIHVSTAFNKLGKMPSGSWRNFSPRHLTADKGFQELLGLVRGFAEKRRFDPQHVANTIHGITKLHGAGRLDAADGSVDDALAALETDTVQVAPTMNPQNVANTVYSFAALGRMPGDKTWAALESAVGRVAQEMNPQAVANVMGAYVKLEVMPDDKTWAALETAAGRVAREMNPQDVANVMLAYATLGRVPNGKTWAALETAAGRVARDMNSQDLATALWASATLFTLRDVEHPPCYAAMWDLVCGLKESDFSDEGLGMLFHVHLMHHFSSSSGSVEVAYPAWLMVDAQDAWIRNMRDGITVSRSHRALASVIGELGIRHELERVTGDGCFSMDIYLPEDDVAVEFDGPSHYYHSSASSSSRDTSKMLRTAKTQLRDWLLAKQCAKVVTVPYFLFDECNTPEKRRVYVREKLAKEAGVKV
jgi:hypothetical protein